MARRMSDPQAADLATFVQHLREVGRFPTWADFARESGYPATNLSDVQLGKAGIDGANLLMLIQAAARRSQRPGAELATEAAPLDRLVLARLVELANLVDETFARLEAGIARVEQRLDRGDGRKRGSA